MKSMLPLLLFAVSFLVLGCIPLRDAPMPGAGQHQAAVPQAPAERPLAEAGSPGYEEVLPEAPGAVQQQDVPSPVPSVPSETQPSPLASAPATIHQPDATCDDRDGGIMPKEKGTVYRYYDGAWAVFTDICNGNTLLEHYCDGNAVKTREIMCEYGCSDSRCLSEPLKPAPERRDEEVDNSKLFYNCYNGYRDTDETGVDCGGPDCTGCGFGKHCKVNSDCADPLVCNVRMKKCSDFAH